MSVAGRTTSSHEADERRAAARALLRAPVLSARHDPDVLAVVRRHQAPLKSTFATVLGYPLVVEASFARLVKAPLDQAAPPRPLQRSRGVEFSPRAYAYLALICAGLLAPGTGEQLLLSGLVDQLKVDAALAGLDLDDSVGEVRTMAAALGVLTDWGVLTETSGTVAGWSERREEALLTVNQAMLPHLLSRPLRDVPDPARLDVPDPHTRREPRVELRRKLVENPLVRREDLSDAERDVLSRERTEQGRILNEAFGLVLEVRAEGALLYDPDDEVTDIAFPGNGSLAQAALLLLDALIDLLSPAPGATVSVDGREVHGVLAGWDMVADNVEDLARRHATIWRADLVADPARLRAEVVALLVAVGLATVTAAGLVVHPAAARFRPDPQRAPARTRAKARLEHSPTPGAPGWSEQPAPEDLFSTDPQEQP